MHLNDLDVVSEECLKVTRGTQSPIWAGMRRQSDDSGGIGSPRFPQWVATS
jgi:hypothetical protein